MIVGAHVFASTGDAYDACQCDEEVFDGDVLIIEDEEVIGVAETWPVAVTRESGALHQVAPEYSPEQWANEVGRSERLLAGWKAAEAEAKRRGWPLNR